MNILSLGKNIALTAAAAQDAVQPVLTPFIPGRGAIAAVDTDGLSGATVTIQGSDDGTTYTDLVTVAAQGPITLQQVTLAKYMRVNVTTAGAAGTASAYLLGSL